MPAFAGLNGVADSSAEIAGVLGGTGVVVQGPDGQVGSELSAVAAAIWFAYLNEAARMLEAHYATADDIDAAMMYGCGYKVGPLRQLDAIGIEQAKTILDVLYQASGDPRHKPSQKLLEAIAGNRLGEKAGAGIFDYKDGQAVSPTTTAPSHAIATRKIESVGVIGTGTMATGIIEVFAKAGHKVIYVARSAEKVGKVGAALEKSLDRAVSKGKLTEEQKAEILHRVTGTTKHEDLGGVDIVVEAIVEDLATKQALFETLDRVCKPGAILATTTSSLSIDTLAGHTKRPADVIGMHFFNPAPIMKLVEVVSGSETDPVIRQTVVDLCREVGKHPVLCGDRAGFIVNFLLFPYLNDAVRAVDAGLSTIDELDALLKTWQNLPMGPFSLLDVVGNDVSLAIENTIVDAFADECYTPAKSLETVVAEGKLGRKTGEGFLKY